jgi:hypothetical protein
MELSTQLLASATLPPEKQPVVLTEWETELAPERVSMLWRREKLFPPEGIEFRLFGYPARNLVPIPTKYKNSNNNDKFNFV